MAMAGQGVKEEPLDYLMDLAGTDPRPVPARAFFFLPISCWKVKQP